MHDCVEPACLGARPAFMKTAHKAAYLYKKSLKLHLYAENIVHAAPVKAPFDQARHINFRKLRKLILDVRNFWGENDC